MRVRVLPAALLAPLLACALAAGAGEGEAPGKGDPLPLPEASAVHGIPAWSPRWAEGSIVVLTIHRSDVEACRDGYQDVLRIRGEFREAPPGAIWFLAVTRDPLPTALASLESVALHVPLLVEKGDLAATLGVEKPPHAVVVGPDGLIAWSGPTGELDAAAIRALLPKVRLLPDLPSRFASQRKALEKGDLGTVRKALTAAMAGTSFPAEDRPATEAAVRWIDGKSERLLAEAAALHDSDPHGAAIRLREASRAFAGLPPAEKAAAALRSLLADPRRRTEVGLGDKLDRLIEKSKDRTVAKFAEAMQEFAKEHPDTVAARRAEDAALDAWAASQPGK
jgi:hypothetical protein